MNCRVWIKFVKIIVNALNTLCRCPRPDNTQPSSHRRRRSFAFGKPVQPLCHTFMRYHSPAATSASASGSRRPSSSASHSRSKTDTGSGFAIATFLHAEHTLESPAIPALKQDYPRNTPPVAFATAAMILAEIASSSASVSVFSAGWMVTAMAREIFCGGRLLPS